MGSVTSAPPFPLNRNLKLPAGTFWGSYEPTCNYCQDKFYTMIQRVACFGQIMKSQRQSCLRGREGTCPRPCRRNQYLKGEKCRINFMQRLYYQFAQMELAGNLMLQQDDPAFSICVFEPHLTISTVTFLHTRFSSKCGQMETCLVCRQSSITKHFAGRFVRLQNPRNKIR